MTEDSLQSQPPGSTERRQDTFQLSSRRRSLARHAAVDLKMYRDAVTGALGRDLQRLNVRGCPDDRRQALFHDAVRISGFDPAHHQHARILFPESTANARPLVDIAHAQPHDARGDQHWCNQLGAVSIAVSFDDSEHVRIFTGCGAYGRNVVPQPRL